MQKKLILPLVLGVTILMLTVNMDAYCQEREKSPEEVKLEQEAAIARHKKEIAEAELEAAKARQAAAILNAPLSNEEKAKAETAIAKAELEELQARRDMYKGPEITALSGKITSNDGVFIESRVLAHNSLESTFDKFVDVFSKTEAGKKETSTFIIYDPTNIPAIELYTSLTEQLNSLNSTYEKVNQAAENLLNPEKPQFVDPITMGYAAAGTLKTIAELASLFRTTTEFKNFDMVNDESLVVAVLSKSIRNKQQKWKVFYPGLFPIYTIKTSTKPSPFIEKLNTINAQSMRATTHINTLNDKIKELQSKLSSEKNEAKKKALKDQISKHSKMVAELTAINTANTQIMTLLSSEASGVKTSNHALIMRAERIMQKLNEPDVYTLKIIATSKGSNKITENLWRSSQIKYSAGTELSCLVINSEGEVVFSESLYEYNPFTKPKNIKTRPN
ncbi:hypothetical protein JAO76_15650 [Pontibacter sp. BT310]|uniref:Uncharacterized protein n=1 Tax=Pontibacter populi TaxID=890055 RepID=A0ABS6XF12_9BACT|nr:MULTISPECIES: hypothetical protein [Pontibacter]MBJ6119644.1 hypothetical protein [Pontibacter sp. BT310]MBR0572071.1 hypothetical protein [Microvirga sp. STS03]MBW3366497.1 hypothetical protein [Pontibacter populi]